MNARPQPSGLRVNLKDVLLLVPAADPKRRVADSDLQPAVRHEIFFLLASTEMRGLIWPRVKHNDFLV